MEHCSRPTAVFTLKGVQEKVRATGSGSRR